MWHLIIPPLVIVVCFALILWYLSLRGTDPEVVQRVETLSGIHEHRLRSALRRFLLRILEKLAQRSKVHSLRAHNAFHEFLQSVKEKRKLSDQERALAASVMTEDALATEALTDQQSGEEKTPVTYRETKVMDAVGSDVPKRHVEETLAQSEAPSFSLTTPLKRRRREDMFVASSHEESLPVRPMVSDQAAHPERPKRKAAERPVEEELIARIAVNPKDYTAYEALGDFYMERESIQDAKECYKQVLKLSPVQRLVKIKIRKLERMLSQK